MLDERMWGDEEDEEEGQDGEGEEEKKKEEFGEGKGEESQTDLVAKEDNQGMGGETLVTKTIYNAKKYINRHASRQMDKQTSGKSLHIDRMARKKKHLYWKCILPWASI